MPSSPVTGGEKRIGKPKPGESPPTQRARGDTNAETQAQPPPWPGSGSSGAQPTTTDIMAAMTAMQNAMVGMETRITQVVKGEVTKQVGIVTQDLNKVKTTVDTLVNDVSSMKKRMDDLESGNAASGVSNVGPRKEEILDVVVKGFKEKRSKDALIVEIDAMLKTILGDAHNVAVEVPTDPANYGILTFGSNAEKLNFYKKVTEKGDTLDDEISFTNKLSWQDRVVEKKLGFLKFHLMAQLRKTKEEVKIVWRRRYVEVNGRKVASYNAGDGSWTYHKTAKLVEAKVTESMETWLAKREQTDAVSESD